MWLNVFHMIDRPYILTAPLILYVIIVKCYTVVSHKYLSKQLGLRYPETMCPLSSSQNVASFPRLTQLSITCRMKATESWVEHGNEATIICSSHLTIPVFLIFILGQEMCTCNTNKIHRRCIDFLLATLMKTIARDKLEYWHKQERGKHTHRAGVRGTKLLKKCKETSYMSLSLFSENFTLCIVYTDLNHVSVNHHADVAMYVFISTLAHILK